MLEFINVIPADVRRPGAALGCDGSVALVWQDDDYYVTADFYGYDTYVYVIYDRTKSPRPQSGMSYCNKVAKDLLNILVDRFPRGEQND